ncbi:MAG: fluoride efflux transporter CrcB [Pseudomonadota bacterium]
MQTLLLVAAGGAIGAVARYLLGSAAGRMMGHGGWPWGTFAANILGGFLMGVLVSVLALRGGADQEKWRLLLGVGLLGGFTTFSSFSLELVLMLQRRAFIEAAGYGAGSMALSVLALMLGLFLTRRVLA